MHKKMLFMVHNQSEIVPEYGGRLSCDRHPKLLFGVVCGMFMNIRVDESVYHVNCSSSCLMFNFDLFWNTSYPNVIVCFIVLLPNNHPAVFIVCCEHKIKW